jgi:hypothetical protein
MNLPVLEKYDSEKVNAWTTGENKFTSSNMKKDNICVIWGSIMNMDFMNACAEPTMYIPIFASSLWNHETKLWEQLLYFHSGNKYTELTALLHMQFIVHTM